MYAVQLIIVLKSFNHIYFLGAVAAVIIWSLDLHSVLIITDIVSSNLDQDEVYNIMWSSLSVTCR
jgi:hypothetical protein